MWFSIKVRPNLTSTKSQDQSRVAKTSYAERSLGGLALKEWDVLCFFFRSLTEIFSEWPINFTNFLYTQPKLEL